MSEKVRVRIAPSPTGALHLGTARTALYNYLYARHQGGTFVFRLEDTDEVRSDEAHTQDIINGLKWLSLNWDEGPDIGGPYAPYRQTQKIDHYDNIANQLIAKGHAYLCYCTTEELAQLKDEQKNSGNAPRYDNRCRKLTSQQVEKFDSEGRVPAIRFKIEEPRIIVWQDGIKGEISIDCADLGGDMVIVKSNGVAIYNFAVVVDDLDMQMTHVIRGEDHIHNTAKQILIYEALGKPAPHFAHVALMFDLERAKLSKRKHGEAVHINRYQADGYMPEAMVNYLAQMSWTPPESLGEIFTLEEAVKVFDLNKVSKSPAIFDIQRLNWFNGHYIRHLPLPLVTQRALPHMSNFNTSGYTPNQIEEIVGCLRDGLTVLSELTESSRFFFDTDITVPADLKDTLLSKESSQKVLDTFLAQASGLPWGNYSGCKAVVDQIGKELGIKGKDLYWPLRAALSGKVQGPDLGAIISILGEYRVRHRVEAALQLCHSR